MNKHSERRLKENEIIFRQANQNIQEFVEDVIGEKNMKVRFYCECSRLTCRRRINITIAEYDAAHKTERQFIVIPGHEVPAVEKVLKQKPDFNLVEKTGKMPSEKSIDMALTQLAAE